MATDPFGDPIFRQASNVLRTRSKESHLLSPILAFRSVRERRRILNDMRFAKPNRRWRKSRLLFESYEPARNRLGAALAHSRQPLVDIVSLAQIWPTIQPAIRAAILGIVRTTVAVASTQQERTPLATAS